ncbi:WD40 repeat domain-containing protein [Streptomycetaceae bacterium NBC_01309]
MTTPQAGGLAPDAAAVSTGTPVVHIFPVPVGHYSDPDLADLDVEPQVGRLLDLLAPFGGRHYRWAAPSHDRGADATQRRLLAWSRHETDGRDDEDDPDGPLDTALYWVGHGWSDGISASLAHSHSPARVGANGITPEQLADHLRVRQARSVGADGRQGWALVVVDACQSRRFVELLTMAAKSRDAPQRVLLIGVSGEGATSLGRFTTALHTALVTTYRANESILLTDLAAQFTRLLRGCEVAPLGDVYDAELRPVLAPVASWMTAPLDTIHHLEDILDDLDPDERRHFVAKAQGAEHGELAWFFEGRDTERAEIVSWLRDTPTGMLVVTGRAGVGKSALLGNIVVHSMPELSAALARRGLLDTLAAGEAPQQHVFDAVVHLSGLTLPQITQRLAAAIGLAPPPSRTDPGVGVAVDVDWLTDRLTELDSTLTFLVDALDESTDPLDTARSLLARIAAVPGVRVVVGTRDSTHETPDAPADDRNLVDALCPEGVHATELPLARDPDAIRRYVARRLRDARDHGAVPDLRGVSDDEIDRAADSVAERDGEFLFARLVVHELIEDPGLLTTRRAMSLRRLLAGNHQDVFAKAVDRLTHEDDRYPVLIQALAHARGRGLPEADGMWADVARFLAGPDMPADADAFLWTEAIPELLQRASAYVIADTADTGAGDSRSGRGGTVYRLAHRTFVEYFAVRHADDYAADRRTVAAGLLRTAADATEAGRMPGYLARHLSGYAADAGLWDELASAPAVLDGLDADAVTADTVRTLFGRADVPPAVAGVVSARHVLATAQPRDRAGVRQLGTIAHSPSQVLDEPARTWGVAAGDIGRSPMHVRLSGHTAAVGRVRTLDFPSGRRVLVSASDDGTIRLWDPLTALQLGPALTGHRGTVEDLCVVPTAKDGPQLASVGGDGTVRLWDPLRGRLLHTVTTTHSGRVLRLCVVPPDRAADGAAGRASTLLATGGEDGTVRLWDADTRREVGTGMSGHVGAVWGMTTWTGPADPGAPHGPTLLATAGDDGTVRLWDPRSGDPAGTSLAGHRGAVWGVCSYPNPEADKGGSPSLLAGVGYDGEIRVWDPVEGTEIGTPMTGHDGAIWGICTLPAPAADPDAPRARLATAGEDGTVRVWDPAARTQLGASLVGHDGAAWGVCPVPGLDAGESAVRTLVASYGGDGTIRLWDPVAQIGAPEPRPAAVGGVWDVAVVADGDGSGLLAAAGADGRVRLWDAVSGVPVRALDGHEGRVLALCALDGADGGVLATADESGTVRVWDAAGAETVRLPGGSGAVWDVCTIPGPGPELLAGAGYDGTVRLWDPRSGAAVGEPLTGHQGAVWALCTCPGEEGARPSLVSAGDDGTVRIWDVDTAEQTGELSGHVGRVLDVCAVRDAEGRTLVAGGGYDGTVRLWDPRTRQQVGEPLTGHHGAVWSVCELELDGELLVASGGFDGTVRLWDPRTGLQTGPTLTGHRGTVLSLRAVPVDPDRGWPCDLLLVGAGEDGTVRLWDPRTGRSVGRALAESAASVERLGGPVGEGCLSVMADGTVRLWSPRQARASVLAPRDPGRPARVAAVPADAPGDTLLVGGADGGLALDARVGGPGGAGWRRRSADGPVLALHALPDHGLVLTGRRDGAIAAHDLLTGDEVAVLEGHIGPVRALCTLPGPGRARPLLVSAGCDGTIGLWDLDTWSPYGASRRHRRHEGWIWSLAVVELPRADGSSVPVLASAGADRTVRLWNAHGEPVGDPLTGHEGQVRAVAPITVGSGPAMLASGGHDGTVRLWDPTDGSLVHSIPLGSAVHALLPHTFGPTEPGGRANRTGLHVGMASGMLTLTFGDSLFRDQMVAALSPG